MVPGRSPSLPGPALVPKLGYPQVLHPSSGEMHHNSELCKSREPAAVWRPRDRSCFFQVLPQALQIRAPKICAKGKQHKNPWERKKRFSWLDALRQEAGPPQAGQRAQGPGLSLTSECT